MWGRTRRRHPGPQTVCVTGGRVGRGLGLWLISPGGLFRRVEIENNLVLILVRETLNFIGTASGKETCRFHCTGARGQSYL